MQRKGSGRLNFKASQLINSNCGGKGGLCAFFLSPASNYTVNPHAGAGTTMHIVMTNPKPRCDAV